MGPFSAAEIRAFVNQGKILPGTAVRKADGEKWIKAGRIKGLFDGVQPQPEAEEIDPLIALTSQAASSVASATGSAASAIGGAVSGWLERRKEPPRKAELIVTEAHPTKAVPALLSAFTLDDQPEEVITKVVGKVREILMEDEELTYVAVQNKPVVNWMPDCIVLTNKRFIFYHPKVLGRIDFEDYVWRELRDARLSEDILGSTITIRTAAGRNLSMNYLPKSQARAVYRIAQGIEERSLEERRNRALEEKRASAGGVIVQTAALQTPLTPPPAPVSDDPMQKLRNLKIMAEEGLISATEYEAKKSEILSKM